MSGQSSCRGRGGRAGPGASLRPLLRQSWRGPQVLPSAAARDIALAGSGGGSCRGCRSSLLPCSPRLTLTPLLLRSPPSSPHLPRPPRIRRPSGAARLQLTGLESRLGAPDSRPPARPLPPPSPAPSPLPSPPPPPPPSSGAQAQPPPPLPPPSSAAAAAEHHGRRRERAQQSAQPASSLSLRLLGVSARPGGGGGRGRGRRGCLGRPRGPGRPEP